MAKKIQVSSYTFDVDFNKIRVKDNIPHERFLLITDVTNNNLMLYNFADSSKTFESVVFLQDSEETEVTLRSNVLALGCTANDALQIFIEDHEGETFHPTEDLLDAVGKMRVSNPGNLIDTDFEYGLQSTKWETTQTVNNLPTVFAEAGGTPVEGVTAVTATAGSKQVKVTTNTPHGLSIGNPISVQGVADYQAEGFFIISGVSDTLNFFFELDVEASSEGDISGSYTTITAAKFYEGSAIDIHSATSDGAAESNITVTTGETHGFAVNTKAYLRNTIGPKTLTLSNASNALGNAPDGRPYVDTESFFTLSSNVLSNATVTARQGYLQAPVISYDWQATKTYYLTPESYDSANDYVNIVGHGLRDNYCLLYNHPNKDANYGSFYDGRVYYVKVIDDDNIELYNDRTLSTKIAVDLVSENTYGFGRFCLVYRIAYHDGNYQRKTIFGNSTGGTESRYTGYTYQSQRGSYRYQNLRIDNYFSNPVSSTSITVNNFYVYGDLGGSREYGYMYFNYNSPVYNYYMRRNTTYTVNYRMRGNSVFQSGSLWYLRYSVYIYYYVSYISWRFYLTNTYTVTITETLKKNSGGDLYDAIYGLGDVQPDILIPFMGDGWFGGSWSDSVVYDYYAYLNASTGRHGVIYPPYRTTLRGTPQRDGNFNVNFNDPYGARLIGDGSETFYIFAQTLTADRNTIYIQDHGIDDGDTIYLVVDSTAYANGERFAFLNSSGSLTTINQQTVEAKATVVNDNVIKAAIQVSPNTDDIGKFPSVFRVEYRTQNALFNTIYIQNHKIAGSAEATLRVEGQDGSINDDGTVFSVTNSGTADYLFTETDLGQNVPDPDLTLYRGNTYRFDVNASGHPFYLSTTNNNYSSGSYVDEYTTGVSNTRTETGNLVFAIASSAPSTLYYYCGNHEAMGGTITIKDKGTTIGGLEQSTVYNLSRVNDSRISLAATTSTEASATTSAIGSANNDTATYFVDIETPLGVTPSSASVSEVEFRGDFASSSEYVVITFGDGDEYFIGVSGGQDGDTYISDQFFGTKDITSSLITSGGKVGFGITVNPTSAVNFRFADGRTKYYQLRFKVSASSGKVALTNNGAGQHDFVVGALAGAYDGVYTITSTPDSDTYTIGTDFRIPTRDYEFRNGNVDTTNDTITFVDDHNFITGEAITYEEGLNTSILANTGEETGVVYAIPVEANVVALASSYQNALNNTRLDIQQPSGVHRLRSNAAIKLTKATGLLATTVNSTAIVGTGTTFLTNFKRFDKIYMKQENHIKAETVDQVTTDTNLTLFDAARATTANTEFFYSTQMVLRPDGYQLHLPFDGGVDITAGTSPNSKITRQTRKYFRYQSGKGIQNSVAINFNPGKLVSQLIKSANSNAIVTTQEAHGLVVGDDIKIDGAEVTSGNNFYNVTTTVNRVIDPFQFQYEMQGIPEQQKAGGFPIYYRENWVDSFVRTGMFDDQNGFFWEYDGQAINCVRRSSTLQIAGSVDVTRGSQVVNGRTTSFTSQLQVKDKVVIRGQTYQIVEISSDSRMVVQPAYRGVTATRVKVTKTVDTRVPQTEWNLDKCDGTGPSGFILDTHAIQMAYSDFSWYGAGKIRFGFKDRYGHVKYVHEFRHNNRLNESYFRSGNLPGRYEIENGPAASTAPTLFHFGTSVIMDGTFDDDKAYLFTRQSRPMAFTNGASDTFNTNATSTFELVTLNGRRVYVYALPCAEADAQAVTVGDQIRDPNNANLPEGTYVTQIKEDGASSKIFTNYPALSTQPSASLYNDISSSTTITTGETEAIDLSQPLPLVSLRLAPSVDSSLTGAVGEREIINRMQLALKQAGITTNKNAEVFLILNALPSELSFEDADKPSLSEVIEHKAGDTLTGGVTILATKVSSGSAEIALADLLELGNSILGGDSIFPAGPDLLTVAVQPQSTAGVTYAAPFEVSGKISWSESQA